MSMRGARLALAVLLACVFGWSLSLAQPQPHYVLAGIDIYGNTKTPDSAILGILNIPEGAEIDAQIVTALDERLRATGMFAFAQISSTMYGDGKSFLTVDIVEKGEEDRLKLNAAPTGSVAVPQELLDWVHRYEKASLESFQSKPRRLRDLQDGHYIDSDPAVREYEERMLVMVPQNYDILVKALREDKDPEKRASCAMLLGWAKDKKAVIVPLEAALKDPSVEVRANAARSLVPIAYLAAHTATPFPLNPVLDLLHHPTSPDRTKALAILLQLGEDKDLHETIRENAGGLLVKMVGIKQPVQREHAVILLSLISGEKYGRDAAKWQAWWKAQKAGGSPKKKETANSPKPASGGRK
jgi:hypothetical protein